METDDRVGERELAFELGVALRERENFAILGVELGLATRLLRLERRGAAGVELLAPRREKRAVDPLLAKERLDRAALAACRSGRRGLHDPPLVGRRERPS